jgi:hypothetical protein
MVEPSGLPSRTRKAQEGEFRLIFLASFVIFLLAGIVARLLPPRWRRRVPGQVGYESIFGEAKAAANTFVPFAFMG